MTESFPILITGANGMLGHYVKNHFMQIPHKWFSSIMTLGKHENNDYSIDLTKDQPDFKRKKFGLLVHCAGTEDNSQAELLNLNGTHNLIKALEETPPDAFVYISSWQVYSPDAGEDITEDNPAWPVSEAGKSKIRTENLLKEWSDKNGVTLTILRPARMFGTGIKGEMLTLFNNALKGNYIHIRGNDAKVSIVTAFDVARSVEMLYNSGGIYNISDGINPKFIDLVEAMTANAGKKKRMVHLPADWAEWIWRLGRWIPIINGNLHPDTVEKRLKSLTIDSSKCKEKLGFEFYNTLSVIERSDKDYPYDHTD